METLTVTACVRLTNTASGSPRYRLMTADNGWGVYTAPDSQAAYSIPASIYPGMAAPVTVLVSTDSHGDITQLEEVSS